MVSSLLLLMRAPRSVDVDLLTGGDGDLSFLEVMKLSSAIKGSFVSCSLSDNPKGRQLVLCFPEEELLT